MDTHCFIVHVKLEDVYADLGGDLTHNFFHYEVKRLLSIRKIKKKTALMKDELGKKEFVALRPRIYSYVTDDRCVD